MKPPAVCTEELGVCVNSNGEAQQHGIKPLSTEQVITEKEKEECFSKCMRKRHSLTVTACEARQGSTNPGCFAHTNRVSKGKGNADSKKVCWVMSKCSPKLSHGILNQINSICFYPPSFT